MNETGIKKINTAGKVGYVISILLIICAIAGMVGVAIGTAGAAVISKDEITVNTSTNIDVSSTGNFLSKLNKFIGIDGVEDLNDLNGKETELNDSNFSYINVKEQDGGLVIDARTKQVTFSIKKLIVALVMLFIYLGTITAALYMIKALMNSLKTCETPFADDVIRNMTRFANSLIPVAVMNMLGGGIWSSLSIEEGYSPSLNIGTILLIVVVYLLVTVFKYGAQLQRESDETL